MTHHSSFTLSRQGRKLLPVFVGALLRLAFSAALPAQSVSITPPVPRGEAKLEKIRVFHLFPDYRSVGLNERFVPLSTKQKFQFFAGSTFDPANLILIAAVAGIQQGGDFSPAYGQGGEAYAKRFGAMAATFTTGRLLADAVAPTLFHQDPRYFRKGSGSVGSRIFYAISRTMVTRSDSGRTAFNYSGVFSLGANSGIQNAYYPDVDRTGARTAQRFGVSIGVTAALNILREFGPERK